MNDSTIKLIDDAGTTSSWLRQLELGAKPPQWKVLVVDDDESVHEMTRLVLGNTEFIGKTLNIISAFSATQAKEILEKEDDVAVVLLDVVMETATTGLELAREIRHSLGMLNTQIVLRTGQPGYYLEEEIFADLQINDLRSKSELTQQTMYTIIYSCLRSYERMTLLEESRYALRRIIKISADIMLERSVSRFAAAFLGELQSLFNLSAKFMVITDPGMQLEDIPDSIAIEQTVNEARVIATLAEYHDWIGFSLKELQSSVQLDLVKKTLIDGRASNNGEYMTLYLETTSHARAAILVENAQLTEMQLEQIDFFFSNVALGLENAKMFTEMRQMAYVDPLTMLPTRNGFIDAVLRSSIMNPKGSFYVIDIDDFHGLVSSLGFDISDAILMRVGSYLNTFTENELCAAGRLQGDTFALYVTDEKVSPSDIINYFLQAMDILGQMIRVSVSVGYANHHSAQTHAQIRTGIRHAELALKVAKKRSRGGSAMFQREMELLTSSRLIILQNLHLALDCDGLHLVLQPKYSMREKKVVGFEALLRWQHPTLGNISPAEFIPVAEQSGMALEMDSYVFEKAISIYQRFPDLDVPISVNLSPFSMQNHLIIDRMMAIAAEKNFDLSRIQVELTEGALVSGQATINLLFEINALGMKICLDDFGTGYSSMCYLLDLPLQVIKIDRSFIRDIDKKKGAMVVLEAMLKMCTDLDMQFVVEGAETEEEIKVLTELGVDVVQGYYFYKPMPVSDAVALVLPKK